jgi:signal transduction histidine kinase
MYTSASLSWPGVKRASVRWSAAFVAAAVALLVARELKPFLGQSAPLVTIFPVVAFVAWRCGLGPSFLSIVIALLGTKYWFVEPLHSLRVLSASQAIAFLMCVFACGLVAAMGEAWRRENDTLLNAQEELEDKVRRRTIELDRANQNLSELTARLLRLQDEERRRIARDLHDSIGQTMAVLGVNLSNVQSDIEGLLKTLDKVKDSQEIIRETTTSVRTISYLLHPPLLDENGLSSALPWYTEGFAQRSGIKVNLELPDDLGRLSRDSEVAIFRLVQECLTNIHRHSGGSNAKVSISCSDTDICVKVEDDGKGIPAHELRELASGGTPGVGVRGMRERIRQLGGSLEIVSEGTGRGTVIVTRMPFLAYEPPAEIASSSDATVPN